MQTIKLLIQRSLSWALRDWTFTMPFGIAQGIKRRYGLGFRPTWQLTRDEQFLRELDYTGQIVYDVGGYIGLYTLFFASRVGPYGHVVTFEPHPGNHAELRYNVALNGFTQVTLFPVAVGREAGLLDLTLDPLNPARSTFFPTRLTYLPKAWKRQVVQVEVVSLDQFTSAHNLPHPDFIKIDVEGSEIEALTGMTRILANYRPRLFIEVHGPFRPVLVDFLQQARYTLYHIETDQPIQENKVALRGGHLFCEPVK